MKNIIITGGAGFIGSHTCLKLLERDYQVFVIDSFINSDPIALKKILEIIKINKKNSSPKLKVYKCDLRDKILLENIFSEIFIENKVIDGVIHFAGLKAVEESIKYPLNYWTSNVLATINLLEIMKKFFCNTLVFSSSATIYDQSNNSIVTENSPLNPINPYGKTKLTVESFLEDLYNSQKNNYKFASLRYFNPIGAHDSGLIGENPIGKANNIFPLILNTAFGVQKEIKIYGNDWPTKDGTPIRDYIHVMDLAEAHINILERLILGESRFLTVNIGTGKGTSVLELLKIFEKVNNVKIPYSFSKRRKGDKSYVVSDNKFLKKELKFEPKLTIEDMCIDGWRWRKLNPNGYK